MTVGLQYGDQLRLLVHHNAALARQHCSCKVGRLRPPQDVVTPHSLNRTRANLEGMRFSAEPTRRILQQQKRQTPGTTQAQAISHFSSQTDEEIEQLEMQQVTLFFPQWR